MPVCFNSMERLFNLLDLIENPYISEKVREALLALGTCFAAGDEDDELGVSLDQIEYIDSLAGFDELEGMEFVDICREAGGLDSNQASYLIDALLLQSVEVRHDQEQR